MTGQQNIVTYRPKDKTIPARVKKAAKKLGISPNKFIDRAVTESIILKAFELPEKQKLKLLKMVTKIDKDFRFHSLMCVAQSIVLNVGGR